MNTEKINSNGHLSSGPALICLILILAVGGLYHQVRSYEFVSFDDGLYVTENYRVQKGLARDNLNWALTTTHASNWHPLTWASHMLDVQLFGLDAGRHHLTNVYFHILNSLLLFWVLRRMSNNLWQSGFVAAVFAIHPLHVESVAWVSERKDVLSAFFWMLTIGSYARYVRRPDPVKYLMTLLLFILGLLAKPMGVTLPFVLLLLDYWPLGRIQLALTSGNSLRRSLDRFRHLVLEKIPFFIFTLASCIVTFYVQRSGGAVASLDSYPLTVRISNALVAYVSYIAKMLRPVDLAVFYPHPGSIPAWQVLTAAAVLISITVLVLKAMKERPYLAVGWFWYFGTLIPVIGLVQIGGQAIADRYTYIPLIGLYIMVAWGVPDILCKWRYKKIGLIFASTVLILALMGLTGLQIRYWAGNFTLYDHALKVTSQNHVAHNNLGVTLMEKNKFPEAAQHFAEAIRIKPDQADGYYNIGVIFEKQNNMAKAIEYYGKALKKNSKHIYSHNNFGNALVRKGRYHEAIQHYSVALKFAPDDPEIQNNLGVAFIHVTQPDQAIDHFRRALEIRPGYTDAATNLQKATKALKPRT
jgi:hypothetical protein